MASKQLTTWEKIRSFTLDLHMWMGLIGGIFIFIICLTGTIYTFSDEIMTALNKDVHYVTPQGQRKTVQELEKIVAQQQLGTISSITIPDATDEAYTFGVVAPNEKRPTPIKVDPYKGVILGKGEKGKAFFQFMFKAHRWLLLDQKIGRPIVGVATLLFALGCITGLIIWFPRKIKNYKQGFKIKTSNWKRLNHDLHNALGFYSFIFILIMALTGLTWSFEWYKNGLNTILGVPPKKETTALATEGNKTSKEGAAAKPRNKKTKDSTHGNEHKESTIHYEQLLAIAQQHFNYSGSTRISKQKKTPNEVSITKAGDGFWANAHSDVLKINIATNSVISFEKFSDKPFGQQIASSYKALHLGTIYGTGTKIIYFISCLIATSLPITGTIIWWNKLRKKRRKMS